MNTPGAERPQVLIFNIGGMLVLYRIGTVQELHGSNLTLPDEVLTELVRDVAILDLEYGKERDWSQVGGYAVVAETSEDVSQFQELLDFETRPCEWATRIGRHSGYLSVLYLLNDDYVVTAFMPIAVAPDTILNELEEK